jgi:hypothetical protein
MMICITNITTKNQIISIKIIQIRNINIKIIKKNELIIPNLINMTNILIFLINCQFITVKKVQIIKKVKINNKKIKLHKNIVI